MQRRPCWSRPRSATRSRSPADTMRTSRSAVQPDVEQKMTMEVEFQATLLALADLREKARLDPAQYRNDLDFLSFVARHAGISNSQMFQDLWILFNTGEKHGGYFVEFGICDGVTLSNTLLLERSYGWTGVVAEPARRWHDALHRNRQCFISDKCVHSEGDRTLRFRETDQPELSTIEALVDSDVHAAGRRGGMSYDVETITLEVLLAQADAPPVIDYLSMDIEGGELDVIRSFDFTKYDIRLMTVEHNYSDRAAEMRSILEGWGYRAQFQHFSMFDDWYVKIR